MTQPKGYDEQGYSLPIHSRLHYTLTRFGGHALARALWWRHIRRHDGEICQTCGRPVAGSCPTWWHADDALWMEVNGHEGGCQCLPCFTEDCRATGIQISWTPVVEFRQVPASPPPAARALGSKQGPQNTEQEKS